MKGIIFKDLSFLKKIIARYGKDITLADFLEKQALESNK
jgi:hypothetical protein